MMSTLLTEALAAQPQARPPIWLMRQAGRYQRSYMARRARYGFDVLCRTPALAAETAAAAVAEFDFDAGILFSDLIYPLHALGFGLSYDEGPPRLSERLTDAFCDRLRSHDDAIAALSFQAEAVAATRALLPRHKALIGFIGGPWTLFVYAMEGTHTGALARSKSAPALYRRLSDRLVPLLRDMARAQLAAGADLVMVFDTAAGELTPLQQQSLVSADLASVFAAAPGRIGYYAKHLHHDHLAEPAWLRDAAVLGLDARWNLAPALTAVRVTPALQGNFDPALLQLPRQDLERAIDGWAAPLRALDAGRRRGWICGLGHGVLPGTPEDHVRLFVDRVRELFT